MRPENITPVVVAIGAWLLRRRGFAGRARGISGTDEEISPDSGHAENGTASAGPGGEPFHNSPVTPPARPAPVAGAVRQAALAAVKRHPLYRSVRFGFFAVALVGSGLSLQHLILTIEAIRSGSRIDIPDDNKRFADTLAGAVATAIVTMDFDGEINRALDEQDFERAAVLHGFVGSSPRKLTPATAKRYEEENGTAAQWWRNGADLIKGAVTGRSDGIAGMAGALAVDLGIPFVADVRDVGVEIANYARGAEVDEVVLGLAGVGLAMPVAQAATDPLKVALRYGRRSGGLLQDMRRSVGEAFDFAGAKPWLRSGAYWSDPGGIARFVRPDKVETLRRAGDDLGATLIKGGPGAAAASLRYADHVGDLTLYRRTAEVYGKESGPVIHLLGRRLPELFRVAKISALLVAKAAALVLAIVAAVASIAAAASSTACNFILKKVTLRVLGRRLARGVEL